MKDYADAVAFLGQWGRFQLVVFFLLCASIVPNGFGSFTLVFVTDIPDHHCIVPDVNLTEDWPKIPIKFARSHNFFGFGIANALCTKVVNGKQELSRCSRYRLDVVRNLSAQGLVPGRDVNLTDLDQESCVDGWSYSRDIYQSTIVSEYDLVCSDQWKQPFTSTVYFVGVLTGSFFSGQLSDRFGRKPVLFATMAVQTIFTFIQAFSVSWAMFTILLFINGLGQISNFGAALVLGSEILTGNARILYSSLGSCMGFAIGYMALPLCAYYFRDWKSLQLVLAAPGLACIPLWWFIPESPRWLLSQGRVEEAEAIVRNAAKWNKVKAPGSIFQEYSVEETKTGSMKKHNIVDLLTNSSIRGTTLTLCFVWLSMTTGYYGVSFNTSQLHADPYISCFISAAVEIPAYISSWLALRFLPRRLSVIGTLIIGAVALYLIQLVPESLPHLAIALEMFGKYGFTTGTSLMFAYTAELYPTVLRNTATGTGSTVSRLGTCITPFLLKLNVFFKYLPYIIMGTMAAVSAIAALFLPESFGLPLPETIQQMHKRGRVKCPCTEKEAPKSDSPL